MLSALRASGGGRYAGSFLEWGTGARPMALADAAVAMAGNGETFYYNPASLVFLQRAFVNLMYAPTFGSLSDPMAHYHIAGLSMPLESETAFAFHWARFSVNDIPVYPELQGKSFSDRNYQLALRPDGTQLGTIRDTEDALYLSVAKNITFPMPLGWWYDDLPVDLPLGVNFKLIRQVLGEHDASALGVDVGGMLRFHLGRFLQNRKIGRVALGVSVKDISRTELKWDTEHRDRIMTTRSWGLHYQHPIRQWDAELNFYYTKRVQYESRYLGGVEFTLKNLALRIGRNADGLTAGAGLYWWRLHLNYAFVANDFQDVHRLSCGINLGDFR
ncbi:MAG: hypothetical protein U5R06_10325 [candidate division KSB1 bacterium]|nr:hypothetical protein [candidate division KSB1 bacterium]